MPSLVAGQDLGDRMVLVTGSQLLSTPLPSLVFTEDRPLEQFPGSVAFAPDGRLFSVRLETPPIVGPPPTMLYEIDAAGSLRAIGAVPLEPTEEPLDITFGLDGELYLLSEFSPPGAPSPPGLPSQLEHRLMRVDLETAQATVIGNVLNEITAIAPAPKGLWLLGSEYLQRFDLEAGVALLTEWPLLGTSFHLAAADTDSSGAIWVIATFVPGDPPSYLLYRFDPVTGALQDNNLDAPLGFTAMAIRRRCQPSATARCLLGGRFRASVRWQDFDQNTGDARAAPSGSADSALFWFFDPSNWEVLVKLVDGCADNGHFWVFAAGTTNVGYTLEVTDLATGQVYLADNPLGQASAAVVDNQAFAGCL